MTDRSEIIRQRLANVIADKDSSTCVINTPTDTNSQLYGTPTAQSTTPTTVDYLSSTLGIDRVVAYDGQLVNVDKTIVVPYDTTVTTKCTVTVSDATFFIAAIREGHLGGTIGKVLFLIRRRTSE